MSGNRVVSQGNLRYSFDKSRRVLRSSDFALILREGGCAADATLVIFVLRRENDDPSRMGVTIPRRTGNAVVRNRWKRLIRESFRTQQHMLPAGYDFVVRPKKGAEPIWEAIKKSIPNLMNKAIRRLR